MTIDLAHDPRWRRLHGRPWVCDKCGQSHTGLFALVCQRPDVWPAAEPPIGNADIEGRNHFLSEDFCVLHGEHRFVRCVLELPIVGGAGAALEFGVWSSLSEPSFLAYAATFDGTEGGGAGPWFGWFSNQLPFYPDTINLRCRVHPRDDRRRPWIELEPTGHPLSVDQRQGVSFDRLLEIYAAAGHDPRSALTA